jgi:hypothetical protein
MPDDGDDDSVTVVLPWCYRVVTVVLQLWVRGVHVPGDDGHDDGDSDGDGDNRVTVLSQCCYSGATVSLQCCCSGG